MVQVLCVCVCVCLCASLCGHVFLCVCLFWMSVEGIINSSLYGLHYVHRFSFEVC